MPSKKITGLFGNFPKTDVILEIALKLQKKVFTKSHQINNFFKGVPRVFESEPGKKRYISRRLAFAKLN